MEGGVEPPHSRDRAACCAVGRSLTYNELVFLQEQGVPLRPNDYRMQELLRLVIKSDLFLKK